VPRPLGGRVVVVWHPDELRLPATARALDHGVARIGRASLHGVSFGPIVGVCWQAHTPGVDDEPITEPNDARNVGVTAEHHLPKSSREALLDLRGTSESDAASVHGFEEVCRVVRSRSVNGKHLIEHARRRRKRRHPLSLSSGKPLEREAIGVAVVRRSLMHDLTIAIARDLYPALLHEQRDRFVGPERP
jgi:hypothetical protein